MSQIFSLPGIIDFLTLLLLQTVFSIDNLLYIVLTSNKVDVAQRMRLRRMSILGSMVIRVGLSFAVLELLKHVNQPFYSAATTMLQVDLNMYSIILVIGGCLLFITGMRELKHIAVVRDKGLEHESSQSMSFAKAMFIIVLMNVAFSFDSTLSTVAFTDNTTVVIMSVIAGSLIMYFLADKLSSFIQRTKNYEIIGLMMLVIVGAMLITEGLHICNLHLFGFSLPMIEKQSFYISIGALFIVQLVSEKYAVHNGQFFKN